MFGRKRWKRLCKKESRAEWWVQREQLNWRARGREWRRVGGLGRSDLQGPLGKPARVEAAAGALRSSQRTLRTGLGRESWLHLRFMVLPEELGRRELAHLI